MPTENLIDKVKLYKRKVKECKVASVDIEQEEKKDGIRALIETGEQDEFESSAFNVKTDIIITIRDLKTNWQEVDKAINKLQQKLEDEVGHQDVIGPISRIDDESDYIKALTVSTDYRHI